MLRVCFLCYVAYSKYPMNQIKFTLLYLYLRDTAIKPTFELIKGVQYFKCWAKLFEGIICNSKLKAKKENKYSMACVHVSLYCAVKSSTYCICHFSSRMKQSLNLRGLGKAALRNGRIRLWMQLRFASTSPLILGGVCSYPQPNLLFLTNFPN